MPVQLSTPSLSRAVPLGVSLTFSPSHCLRSGEGGINIRLPNTSVSTTQERVFLFFLSFFFKWAAQFMLCPALSS